MSSSSSPMDYQKPVKVKSRWTQSCQMEMMMEESQSSFDMSDTITDISTSDLNESTDYTSELNSVERRRSRRTGSNRTDYRQLLGLKTTRQKKPIIPKTGSKKGRKKKQPLDIFTNNKNNFKNDISLEFRNIIKNSDVDWNCISICGSSKSDIELPSRKCTRRGSLSWNFKFPTMKQIEDNKNPLEKNNSHNISYAIDNLNLSDTLLVVKSPITPKKIFKDDKSLFHKDNEINDNPSQPYCPDIDALSCKIVNKQNQGVLKMTKIIETSITSQPEQLEKKNVVLPDSTHFDLLTNQNCVKNDHQINEVIVSKYITQSGISHCHPTFKFRHIRSKSVDSIMIGTKNYTYNSFKRSKSCDFINNSENSLVNVFKIQKPPKKSPKKKRRQSLRIKPKINNLEIFEDIRVPEINYDQVADEIFKEHKKQLFEARSNDFEFDQKLKSTNFTLINENLYRPDRQTMKIYPSSEISALRKLKQRVISGDINVYCECTLSKEDIIEGKIGCDDQCLNRLLKIECSSSCYLKQYCTNKQFQNKNFKRTKIIKTENKGYGICAVEDIPKGVLIYEYVGEVIDYNEMCNRLRKKEYQNLNYMVQLNSDEIIDSTSKGNNTRFINHSCDPNSVGEKWHVLGQSRMGFFSTRDIVKGEEITFDYSFQVFGNGAQVCYCGSPKCRGYISKASQITDPSSSEDSDDNAENHSSKPEEKQKRKIILKRRIAHNEKNKLRELDKQLTEISKLKTGLKAEQEMASLNLNRLMVHITDSVSRLHILTFIREHDMNYKRLFMDFNGLSIIHNWMTSNENESFKLMILEMLSELPITNRNTITKSKVLDVVAEWADIPQDVKTEIERLENLELQKQCQEIEKLLPNNNNDEKTVNNLVEKARALWKKWIVLKLVFKIPKKIDLPKPPIEEINSKKVTENFYSSTMDTASFDNKMVRISNKNFNKVRNPKTISFERLKLRKEYEQKVEQERKETFRKKVMDNWLEKRDAVMKIAKQSRLQHQPIFNLLNCNDSMNHNNGIIKQTRWDCSSHVSNLDQNSIANYNMQITCPNFIPPQTLPQPPQPQHSNFSYIQPSLYSNYYIDQSSVFNTPPPPLPNQAFIIQNPQPTPLLSTSSSSTHQYSEPDVSPTTRLLKLAETNVFNIINESIQKHCNLNQNVSAYTKVEQFTKKPCSRTVQCGADLMARVKVISNSFKNQPSKLIKINQLKQKMDKSKSKKVISSDIILKSVCDGNKRITFINEKDNISSHILSKDMILTPKTIPLSGKNPFANAILNSLFKKAELKNENLLPNQFVLNNLNADMITCNKTKEIELYRNMKSKIIKKVVGRIKTKNGFVVVKKRKWGIQLKGIKGNHDKIPATKRGIMRKGNLHRISLKNHLVNTKSALKKRNSNNDDYNIKRPKEKRVTFLIEGESSPIFPHSEVRPINLNQDTLKQKPLMKCHPFEIRNEPPKSILQFTSANLGDQSQCLEQSVDSNEDQIIAPIVSKFKASRKRIKLRQNSKDFDQFQSQRKYAIPMNLVHFPVDILKLIPDNRKEMKKVIDYHYSMANVIVKTLGSYAKTTCQQGRIRSDDDFKFLAKKINENILLKELQLKKVDKLKISDTTKKKVAEYIRKYMLQFGEIYKRKSNEQTPHHKTK